MAPRPSLAQHAASRGRWCDQPLVNGVAGVAVTVSGRPFAVMGFTVSKGKFVEIDAIADPERVHRIAAAVL